MDILNVIDIVSLVSTS